MRRINTDALKYRRMEYGTHDDVSMEEREKGILYLLKEDIDNAPTIDPVKHGKWIPEKTDNPRNETGILYVCSCCGAGYQYETNFCPKCGAKMERSESCGT